MKTYSGLLFFVVFILNIANTEAKVDSVFNSINDIESFNKNRDEVSNDYSFDDGQDEKDTVYSYYIDEENGTLNCIGTCSSSNQKEISLLISECGVGHSVDFRKATFEDSLDITLASNINKNVLIYINEDEMLTINGTTVNVICNDTCKNFVITDNVSINIIDEFTALEARYTRSINSASIYGTLCLPFKYVADDNISFFNVGSFNDAATFMCIDEYVDTIPAGEPTIFKKLDENATSIDIVSSCVTVVKDAGNYINEENLALIGTFNKIVVGNKASRAREARDYFYVKSNSFYRGKNSFNIGTFRAYIDAKNNTCSNYANLMDYGFGIIESGDSIKVIEKDILDEFEDNNDDYIDEDLTDLDFEVKDSLTEQFNDDVFVDPIVGRNSDAKFVTDVQGIDDTSYDDIIAYYSLSGDKIKEPKKGINIVVYSSGMTKKIFVK
jgi:hypothetical protein